MQAKLSNLFLATNLSSSLNINLTCQATQCINDIMGFKVRTYNKTTLCLPFFTFSKHTVYTTTDSLCVLVPSCSYRQLGGMQDRCPFNI